MVSLSDVYVRTLDLLNEKKAKEASALFGNQFVTGIKKLYSEVAETYPERFAKTDNWCVWTRHLYMLTRMTEDALGKNDQEKVREYLVFLREHFNVLHVKAEFLNKNDFIYNYHLKLSSDDPLICKIPDYRISASQLKAATAGASAEEKQQLPKLVKDPPGVSPDASLVDQLKALHKMVSDSTPSMKARADTAAYKQAEEEWSVVAPKVLEDNRIDPSEMALLQEATRKFYREFGVQFE